LEKRLSARKPQLQFRKGPLHREIGGVSLFGEGTKAFVKKGAVETAKTKTFSVPSARTSTCGLSDPGIEQKIRDTESHAEEDQHRGEEAGACNTAYNLIYSIERSLEDIDGKVDADDAQGSRRL
jgi:molecular chaperone DnaK (HSP70)